MIRITQNDEKTALWLAATAYQKDRPGDNIIYINADNEKTAIIIEDDRILIGAAGSNDFKDWLQNARIVGTNTVLYGRVMGGFLRNIDKLIERIYKAIKDHRNKPIHFAGHSRGGAIVLLLAIALHRQGFNVSDGWLIGFGVPNVGKQSFVDRYNQIGIATALIKNGGDQVTRNPRFGYKKPVYQKHIGPKRNWFTAVFNADHLIENYDKHYGVLKR